MNRPLFLSDPIRNNDGGDEYELRAGDAITGPVLISLIVQGDGYLDAFTDGGSGGFGVSLVARFLIPDSGDDE